MKYSKIMSSPRGSSSKVVMCLLVLTIACLLGTSQAKRVSNARSAPKPNQLINFGPQSRHSAADYGARRLSMGRSMLWMDKLNGNRIIRSLPILDKGLEFKVALGPPAGDSQSSSGSDQPSGPACDCSSQQTGSPSSQVEVSSPEGSAEAGSQMGDSGDSSGSPSGQMDASGGSSADMSGSQGQSDGGDASDQAGSGQSSGQLSIGTDGSDGQGSDQGASLGGDLSTGHGILDKLADAKEKLIDFKEGVKDVIKDKLEHFKSSTTAAPTTSTTTTTSSSTTTTTLAPAMDTTTTSTTTTTEPPTTSTTTNSPYMPVTSSSTTTLAPSPSYVAPYGSSSSASYSDSASVSEVATYKPSGGATKYAGKLSNPLYQSPKVSALPKKCRVRVREQQTLASELLIMLEKFSQRFLLNQSISYITRDVISRLLARIRTNLEQARMSSNLANLRVLTESSRQAGLDLTRLANNQVAQRLEPKLKAQAARARRAYANYRKSCKQLLKKYD